jgi:hypothetical protein
VVDERNAPSDLASLRNNRRKFAENGTIMVTA